MPSYARRSATLTCPVHSCSPPNPSLKSSGQVIQLKTYSYPKSKRKRGTASATMGEGAVQDGSETHRTRSPGAYARYLLLCRAEKSFLRTPGPNPNEKQELNTCKVCTCKFFGVHTTYQYFILRGVWWTFQYSKKHDY